MAEPLSAFYSTALNTRIDSYPKLATRILRQLGCPLIKLEVARDACYEFISEAVELWTRYAGYTEEFLLFDTSLYRRGYGLKLDEIVSTTTPELSARHDPNDPNTIVGFDYNLEDYRRVIDVRSFEEGETRGANILFSVQYAMAQHLGSIFYNFGLFKGFDLVSWYNANEFLELRNKLLANKIHFRFDAENQLLRLTPEPKEGYDYYGLVQVYVERRVVEALRNHWVQHYALALTKIAIGNVRGKFGGTQLLGGGQVNYNDLLQQGLTERKELLEEIKTGTSGLANGEPVSFIVM
jgi:hypothetical protein